LDLIGLPDFSSGAMENWGLVTFREQVLYVDPKHSGIETKQFVAMVIAHELSHQWFGNLVTMRWWDDLWLNESFANLMEYRAVDELFPKWRIWEEFVYREVGGALARDALPTVQSVRTEVRHPDELSSLFDPSIVYAKGGSLLNMVRYLIGEDSFKKGLKTYFTQHQYFNTEAADLWRHLGKAAGVDIESMMKNWLQKPGFPVIETDYTPDSKTLKLSQRRLAVGKSTDNSTVWTVPLAASLKLDKPLLNKKSEQFKLEPSGKYPLLLNHNGQSYFAARYLNKDHFESLIAAVKQNTLTPIDRLLLIQSYLLLERAGEVPTLDNVKLLRAYKAEREEAVWSILSGIIGNLRTLIGKDKELETKLNNFLIPIVSPLIKQVGWDAKKSDTSQTLKLRALALSLGAVCQIPEVIKEGLKRFESFEKPADLPADIRGVVYVIAVRFGQKSDFDKLVNLYKRLTNAEDKEDIAAELTATREEARIKQLLSMIATADVRLQDAPTWFAWLIRNKYGNELAWRWMIDNWNWVEEKYGEDKSFDYFPRYAASAFSYPEQLKSYRKFFGNKAELALQRPIKLGIEEVEGRVAWRAKNETAVKDWLSQLR
ncbi:MAG TPA: M1 family aminopeptidase, partial [Candidatus Saccharimonadales bacterium]|nr:M1 family aminopeptidase [Candidatus Saccharimonadales bacterium]